MDDIDALTAAALAAEAQARDFAFLSDGIPTPLCGTPVFPLDLRNLNLLTHAGNPFIVGGEATIEDVRMILWLQSPLYVAIEPPRPRAGWLSRVLFPSAFRPRRTRRQEFIETLPAIDEDAAIAETREWVSALFYDAPPGKGRIGNDGSPDLEEPIASFIASWIDLLASEYGWHKNEIVGTGADRGIPLNQLFQYYRCCKRRRDPDHPFSSALVAKLHGDWLAEDDPTAPKPATKE